MTPIIRFYRLPVAPAPITTSFGDWLKPPTYETVAPHTPGAYQHRGTDFGVYKAAVVMPLSQACRVVAAFNDGSFGQTVCLDHGDGWYSLYAHLSSVYALPGDWAEPGQLLGVTGNTGTGVGYHLHWQLSDSPFFPLDISHSSDPVANVSEASAMLNDSDKQWIKDEIAASSERAVARVMDAYSGTFRQLMRLYFVDGDAGDYADAKGNPIPADPDVLAAIAKLRSAGAVTPAVARDA